MNNLIVSVSPHYHSKNSTTRIMLDVIIALIPALIASCLIFGMRSLMVVAISVAACVAFEYAWCKLMKTEVTTGDLSAVVTGILLAYNVPATMPVWQLLVGAFIAIVIVKMLFGGIGCNFVNPALVGRVAMTLSFTASMTNYNSHVAAVDVLSSATPLAVMDQLQMSDFMTLFLGQHGGVLGETSALALLLGGIYLCVRGVIKPTIPVTFIGSTLVFGWLFGGANPVLSVFSGGLMLGAIFMATDYVTSPMTCKGRVIFGIGCGFLAAAIRVFANSTEGVSFAILLMNLLVPYINGGTKTKPVGGAVAK